MYKEFALTTWLNRKFADPIEYKVNDSADHFVVIGCCIAYGYKLDSYDFCWTSQLSNNLNLNHVNLAMPGAPLDWITDRLDRVLASTNDPKFIIVQLTHTNWGLKHPKWFYGDLNSRYYNSPNDKINIDIIKQILDKYKDNDSIYFTNIWNLDDVTITVFRALSKKYKNFLVNTFKQSDQTEDKQHPGTQSHKILATFLSQRLPK